MKIFQRSKLFYLFTCSPSKHCWGDWYEGIIGLDLWKENHQCERCGKVEGRYGILPDMYWPRPPLVRLK